MEKYAAQLERKVKEIIRPHQQDHPITYNHYFIETIQKARQEHAKKNQARQLNAFFKIKPDTSSSYVQHGDFHIGQLLKALNQRTEADMNRYACSEAVDCMEAYYKMGTRRQSPFKDVRYQDRSQEHSQKPDCNKANSV